MNILILSYLFVLLGSHMEASIGPWSLAVKNNPKRMKPIARNAHTFMDLIRRSDIFVDKTFIIGRLLQIRRYDKILLSLPRMWGKSVNLNMLKTFLEIQVDRYGGRLPLASSTNYKLFRFGEVRHANGDVETLKDHLLIRSHTALLQRYQGKFPVIYISFKGVYGLNCSHVMDQVCSRICDVFQEYKYVKDTMNITLVKKKNDSRFDAQMEQNMELFEKFYSRQINPRDAVTGLRFLSDVLRRHFCKDPFILIDDWDELYANVILQRYYQNINGYNVDASEKACTEEFVREFLNATVQNNPHMYQIILTGTLRVKGVLDSVYEYHGYTSPFYKYYAFNDFEVKALFDHVNMTHNISNKACDWYGGYKLNATSRFSLYSPNSIASFVRERKIDNFRLRDNVSVNGLLLRTAVSEFASLKDGFANLINDRVINIRAKALWDDSMFFSLSHLPNYFDDIGYFRLVRNIGPNGLDLQFANQEVRHEHLSLMMCGYRKLYNIENSVLRKATSLFGELLLHDGYTPQKFITYFQPFITIFFSEKRFRYILQYMTSQITLLHDDVRSEQPQFLETDRNHVFLPDDILYTNTRAVLIRAEILANSTRCAIKRAKMFRHLVPTHQNITTIMYVGLNLVKNKLYIETESQSILKSAPSPEDVSIIPNPQAISTTPNPQAISTTPNSKAISTTSSPQAISTTPNPPAISTTSSPQAISTTPNPQAISTVLNTS